MAIHKLFYIYIWQILSTNPASNQTNHFIGISPLPPPLPIRVTPLLRRPRLAVCLRVCVCLSGVSVDDICLDTYSKIISHQKRGV